MHEPSKHHRLDSPLFLERGKSASSVFGNLSPRLSEEIWTTGKLPPPNGAVLRSEYRTHVTEHRGTQREGLLRLAVRMDPVDLGRILYLGTTPLDGEPSWRELGALAIERIMTILTTLAKEPNTPGRPPWASQCEEVHLSGRVSGFKFGSEALVEVPDHRFCLLEFSWVGTVRHPTSSPISQVLVINELIAELRADLDGLKSAAIERYPVGHNLRHETHAPLSSDELAILNANPVDYGALVDLEQNPSLPDMIPPGREAVESHACPLMSPPPAEAETDVRSLTNSIGLRNLDDTNRFRDQLARAGFKFPLKPEESLKDYVNEVEQTEQGMRVQLELQLGEGQSGYEAAQVLESGLFAEAMSSGLVKFLDTKFSRLVETNRSERWFLEINLSLPFISRQNDPVREERLSSLARTLIDHKRWLI
jgi:hypothetical protein